jgi:hypothetical protein
MVLTTEQINFHKKDVQFFLNNLDFNESKINSKEINVTLNQNFKITNLFIKDLNEEQTEFIQNTLNKALSNMFNNYYEFCSTPQGLLRSVDVLEISLGDFLNYITEI